MSTRKRVEALAREYYALIGRDHHKDRDCHFYVTETVSAYPRSMGSYAVIEATHPGYLNSWEGTFDTHEEAWAFHEEMLVEAIRVEQESAEQETGMGGWSE